MFAVGAKPAEVIAKLSSTSLIVTPSTVTPLMTPEAWAPVPTGAKVWP